MLGPGDPQELQEMGFPIRDTVWLLCDPVWPLRDAAPSFQACGLSPHMVSPVTLLVFSPGCPSGTFKANQGDEACTHCPINSRTTSEGATNCVCRNGYYRADLDPLDMPCTSTSRAPEGRRLTESRVPAEKLRARVGWLSGYSFLSEEQPVTWWEGKWKTGWKGPSWGSHAANMQTPQSWHLAPYPLLLSHVEYEVKVLIHKGTENGKLAEEEPTQVVSVVEKAS